MTGSLVLSSSAGIYYPLSQKGRSAQRPARSVQPPGLLGGLYPHPSSLAEIALQYNHRTTHVNNSGTSPLPVTERRR